MYFLSILRIIGILVICFSSTMLLPALVALIYGDGGGRAFMEAFALSSIAGALLWWFCHDHKEQLRSRDGFLIVVAFWGVLGSLGAIPFLLLDHPDLTISAAFFEAFSGLTTTGATTIEGLDHLPKAILFYRQLLQWLGGMGIIVLAVAIIPLLGVGGGMSLYRAEISGPMKEQKMRPRIAETAKILWIIYSSLTVVCATAYWLAGMTPFDAITHSFSTVSIGGFSTHDASIGYFNSPWVNGITVIFLLISGCNFALHFRAFSNFDRHSLFKSYWRNPEFRTFLFIQFVLASICYLVLLTQSDNNSNESLNHALFQAVSISTTAGYTTDDFSHWPSFLPMLLLLSSFIGGCAGSTGGGLKVIRVLVLYLQGKRELNYLVHPNLIYPIKLGKQVLPERVLAGIWAFFSAYLLVLICCLLAVIACGVEAFDAFNAVVACLNNVGPALGAVSSNFIAIPDSAKWVLTIAMICGRLEIFSLLVLFTPAFWKS